MMCRLSVREGRASDEHFEMSRQVGRWGLGRKEDVGEVGEAIGRAQERAWAPAIHFFVFLVFLYFFRRPSSFGNRVEEGKARARGKREKSKQWRVGRNRSSMSMPCNSAACTHATALIYMTLHKAQLMCGVQPTEQHSNQAQF